MDPAVMAHMSRFYDAWWWLTNHPMNRENREGISHDFAPSQIFQDKCVELVLNEELGITNRVCGEPRTAHIGASHGLHDLDIFVTKVNPESDRVEDDTFAFLNTKVQVWLEFGPIMDVNQYPESGDSPDWRRTHDPELDCGDDTYEDAIISLAALVKEHYGDYDSKA